MFFFNDILCALFGEAKDTTSPGVAEARWKFEAQMTLLDSSKRIKTYTKEELIGIELMSRDDELIRERREE